MMFITLLISLSGNASKDVFFGFRYLEPDAVSSSMGGTFITYEGVSALKGNPAAIKKGFYFGINPVFFSQNYTKLNSTPLANSFNTIPVPSVFFSYLPKTRKFGFSIGYYNLIDFNYKLKTPTFTGTQLTKETLIQSDGSVNVFAAAFSIKANRLSAGLGFEFLNGKRTYSITENNFINDTQTRLDFLDYTVNATSLKMGFIYNFESISLGAVYKTGFSISTDTLELNYPVAFGAGVSYKPSDTTKFAFDFLTSDFSNYASKAINISTIQYQRVDEIRIGVETYSGDTPIRFGMRFEPVYYEKRQQYVFLTAGTSLNIPFGFLDAGINYGRADFLKGDTRNDDVILILNLGFRKEL